MAAPAARKEAAKALAAAVPGSFDYQRINLQTCQVSPGETGYAKYDARIRELSYNSCWSSYLTIQDYEEDDSDGKMKNSLCKRTASPSRIDDIIKAALVLTHFEHGYPT
ncbi:hypothetical protein [Streptosporangium subroseum]|uniref:hypothetical protein n=1 Tax=Streptosporangium subroseum TaxID=106412 RepID=UPI00308657B0|nr:hypothetical protein OHB15_24600 [Streptosporangium subroseum]